jgi:putative membrane protein
VITGVGAFKSAAASALSWPAGAWPHDGSFGGYGWPWPGLIWLIVFILFWAGLITLLVWAVRSSTGARRQPDTAREALRRRLAAGEITEEEFERIKRLLWE